jgi:hypothetical protein
MTARRAAAMAERQQVTQARQVRQVTQVTQVRVPVPPV